MLACKRNTQRGIAVITVLVMTALIAGIATQLFHKEYMLLQKTTNIIQTERALLYALSAEDWVKQAMRTEGKDSTYDGLDELWATPRTLPVDDIGTITITIDDLNAKLNINSLIATKSTANAHIKAIYARTFETIGIDTSQLDAITDWIDEDKDVSGPAGAEDSAYQQAGLPYLPANMHMVDISEIALIRGFTHTDIERMTPYFTVVPVVGIQPVNLNTASEEVLNILGFNADDVTAQRPFKTLDALEALLPDDSHKAIVAIKSHFFRLRINAQFGSGQVELHSVLYRNDNNDTFIIARTLASYYG